MDIKHYLWLDDRARCGVIRAVNLIREFGSADKVYECTDAERFMNVEGITRELAEELARNKSLDKYRAIEESIDAKKIGCIVYEENDYPDSLKQIYAPPPVLFYRGENILKKSPICISIVGSRKATEYGLKAARQISSKLAVSGICIVSGLALGIDAAAHWGCLDVGGTTIGVLGCGADMVYPPSNQYLYDKIINSGGMLISEFFPGTPPIAQNFPRRNRIISGVSFGTVVIEAAKNSGSLHTARYALEQGKNVYALPGSIYSQQSVGSHNLVKEGARLITDAEDIFFDLYDFLRPRSKNVAVSNEPLGEEEEIILTALREGCQTPDALSKNIGRPISYINRIITLMELKQMVAVSDGKIYIAY